MKKMMQNDGTNTFQQAALDGDGNMRSFKYRNQGPPGFMKAL